ncbi:hypothetical protein [uncultured Ruegeria sp.]|uniref:hypothetical protein n=1 Tax=uncultured Ruegeria sp. TaxID=259304 RepID=UPI00262DAD8C|nr:hypothetical protein [uncultured Ruegeria sp.]
MLDDFSKSGFGGDHEPCEDVQEVLFFLWLAELRDQENKTLTRAASNAFDPEQARSGVGS